MKSRQVKSKNSLTICQVNWHKKDLSSVTLSLLALFAFGVTNVTGSSDKSNVTGPLDIASSAIKQVHWPVNSIAPSSPSPSSSLPFYSSGVTLSLKISNDSSSPQKASNGSFSVETSPTPGLSGSPATEKPVKNKDPPNQRSATESSSGQDDSDVARITRKHTVKARKGVKEYPSDSHPFKFGVKNGEKKLHPHLLDQHFLSHLIDRTHDPPPLPALQSKKVDCIHENEDANSNENITVTPPIESFSSETPASSSSSSSPNIPLPPDFHRAVDPTEWTKGQTFIFTDSPSPSSSASSPTVILTDGKGSSDFAKMASSFHVSPTKNPLIRSVHQQLHPSLAEKERGKLEGQIALSKEYYHVLIGLCLGFLLLLYVLIHITVSVHDILKRRRYRAIFDSQKLIDDDCTLDEEA